jgi:peroxiredoxin Q/BCP
MDTIGQAAPAFRLQNQDGTWVDSQDLRGRWVVVYFYPKALTSGCTVQACGLRDNMAALQKQAVILGVSGDPLKLLTEFRAKENLNFDLLSDPDHGIARAYGAWGKKSMYGREYEGILRNTYIIDPAGKLAAAWPKVEPKTHAERLLEWFKTHA